MNRSTSRSVSYILLTVMVVVAAWYIYATFFIETIQNLTTHRNQMKVEGKTVTSVAAGAYGSYEITFTDGTQLQIRPRNETTRVRVDWKNSDTKD